MFLSFPPLVPRSLWSLAPVILVRLTVRFVQALVGPSGVSGPVVRVRGSPGWPVPVRGGRAVAVGDPAWVRVGGQRGPVSGSPGGARLGVRVPAVRVRVAVGKALLVGGGLVVALVLVVTLVEGSVALQAVPGRGAAPPAPVRGSGGSVSGRARRAVPGRGAPVVGGVVARRGPMMVASVVVRGGEVSGGG